MFFEVPACTLHGFVIFCCLKPLPCPDFNTLNIFIAHSHNWSRCSQWDIYIYIYQRYISTKKDMGHKWEKKKKKLSCNKDLLLVLQHRNEKEQEKQRAHCSSADVGTHLTNIANCEGCSKVFIKLNMNGKCYNK